MHFQHHLRVGFALRVDAKGGHAAAAEGVLEEEVEGVQAGGFVAFRGAGDELAELGGDFFGREDFAEPGEVFRLAGEDGDVGGIAFVAAAGVGDLIQRDFDGVGVVRGGGTVIGFGGDVDAVGGDFDGGGGVFRDG